MISFAKKLEAIVDIEQSLRFCLYLDLLWEYETEMDYEMASVLAVQVSNHLMGDDFNKVYKSLPLYVQKNVDEIRKLIGPKVAKAMTVNKEVCEVIIRHIMTTYLIYHCLFDKTFFDKPGIKNREKLINEYGGDRKDIPESEDFDKYMDCALNFIKTRQQALEQRRSNSSNK